MSTQKHRNDLSTELTRMLRLGTGKKAMAVVCVDGIQVDCALDAIDDVKALLATIPKTVLFDEDDWTGMKHAPDMPYQMFYKFAI